MNPTRRKLLRGGAVALIAAAAGALWQRLSAGTRRAYPVRPTRPGREPLAAEEMPTEAWAAPRAQSISEGALADEGVPAATPKRWTPRWSERLVRPPGALPEQEFLAACIRCYRCQDACAPGAIQFFTEADGRVYHTPYVDPAIKACEPCMKCTMACPTGALRPLATNQRREIRMASVALRADLCLSHKAKRIRDEQAMMMELGREPTRSEAPVERRGPCGECFMFCPERGRAITLEPGAFLAPEVHEERCIGCGMCEEICRVMVRGEPAIRIVPLREPV